MCPGGTEYSRWQYGTYGRQQQASGCGKVFDPIFPMFLAATASLYCIFAEVILSTASQHRDAGYQRAILRSERSVYTDGEYRRAQARPDGDTTLFEQKLFGILSLSPVSR